MRSLCACLAAAVVAAPGTVPASVGTLQFAYPARFAHLDFPRAVLVADYRLSKNSPTVQTATFPANGVVFELLHERKLNPPIAAPPRPVPAVARPARSQCPPHERADVGAALPPERRRLLGSRVVREDRE